MQPGMQMIPGLGAEMQMMPGWQPGGAARDAGDAGGDNVYRPSLDFFTASSHTSTPTETRYTGVKTFSLEELGIALEEANTPVQTGGVGRGRGRGAPKKKRKGKGVLRCRRFGGPGGRVAAGTAATMTRSRVGRGLVCGSSIFFIM